MELVEEEICDLKNDLLPENWWVRNIAENSTLKARIGWQGLTTAEYLDNGNYYLVTGTDFENGRINWSTCHFVTKERFLQDRNIQLRLEDNLITKDGTIGKVAYIDKLPLETTLNSGVFVIRPKYDEYVPLYLYYIFNSTFFRTFLNELVAGSTINHLYQKEFVKFSFPLPKSKNEQTAIAIALSDADDLINSLEKLIEKKRNIKQGAMQKLLQPKEGWEMKKLGEVAKTISSGKSNTQSKGDLYPIYGSTEIIGWKNYYDYEGNKILAARVGANAGTLYKVFGKYCVSDNTLMITTKNDVDMEFIFFILNSFNLNSLVFGSGQPLITGNQLKNLKISLPSTKTEQTRIATILSDMDSEILALENKLEKYREIKVGMMQNLLTGKIRLV